jgi:hypothetical protein
MNFLMPLCLPKSLVVEDAATIVSRHIDMLRYDIPSRLPLSRAIQRSSDHEMEGAQQDPPLLAATTTTIYLCFVR